MQQLPKYNNLMEIKIIKNRLITFRKNTLNYSPINKNLFFRNASNFKSDSWTNTLIYLSVILIILKISQNYVLTFWSPSLFIMLIKMATQHTHHFRTAKLRQNPLQIDLRRASGTDKARPLSISAFIVNRPARRTAQSSQPRRRAPVSSASAAALLDCRRAASAPAR